MCKCSICGDADPNNFYQGKSPSLKYMCKKCTRKKRKDYYYSNQKAEIERTKIWQSKNPEKVRRNSRKASKKYQKKLKTVCISHYSNGTNRCACCGENHFEFLSIDHIHGGGNKHRKRISLTFYRWLVKNNFPEGYQVLCMNCNFSLGHFGYCPHRKYYQCGICKAKYNIESHKSIDFGDGIKTYSSQQFKLCPKCDEQWKKTHHQSEEYISEEERVRINNFVKEIEKEGLV